MIRSVIVDDEHDARLKLKELLMHRCEGISVVGEAGSVDEGRSVIEQCKPDLVFLDVMMPPGTGFDLLRCFRTFPFRVIFVTSFEKYAVEAFRYCATDYLLKPVSPVLLREAIEKLTNDILRQNSQRNLEVLLNWDQNDPFGGQTIVIPHQCGFEVINLKEIIYCEGDGYCTHVILTGGRKVLSTRNLKHFDELLTPRNFLRTHQSFLVNLYHIKSYNSPDSQLRLTDQFLAGVGNAYRKKVLEIFRDLA